MFIGTDIVEVERIQRAIIRSGKPFLERIYTDTEILKIGLNDINYERASGFWAAKESIVKAIGLGFRNGILFHDVEVIHDEYGAPSFLLHGRLKEILEEKGVSKISLSISHCRTHAIAITAIV
ncbi:holo-[acyl-carrier-protein] synthase [Acinetobacter sp. ANC 4558]|uniref:holo-ACP synthase n=1 Tax=Acinetobacter sp. ANC 4558 TaxID=1977876 RepID=UPI000A336AB6|nr:holo-ACP synthase [Acinetobacter sp. ANC 4558]OTG86198.1 holo-[acyl-carrier-protein] synthase [Acinetobacter sp. ANC 4558]